MPSSSLCHGSFEIPLCLDLVLQIDRRRDSWNKVYETVLIGAARVGRSNSFPVQFCPSGVPCPKCGKPSCVCPKWAHVAAALED